MVSPFAIDIPAERLATIMAKIAAYDGTELPDAGGWTAGVGVNDLKRLIAYWRNTYDWHAVECRLNRRPQFTADIAGERIHFVHMRGDGFKPPLLLLHGWPGSYLEFDALLDSLVADGHDVIVPSLPGFAFSRPITGVIGPRRAATLMHDLMVQLFGHTRFIVQGGGWGHGIAGWMAHDRPDALFGIHMNMIELMTADVAPTTAEEESFVVRRDAIVAWEGGYSHEHETRPQTLGVAMADSPVGAAAWMYHGKRLEGSQVFPPGTRIRVPTGIAAFPDPVFPPPPRSFVEKTYDVVHWSDMPRGGHFATMEQPELMLADLRAFLATMSETSA